MESGERLFRVRSSSQVQLEGMKVAVAALSALRLSSTADACVDRTSLIQPFVAAPPKPVKPTPETKSSRVP
jgi:hypothetical protein